MAKKRQRKKQQTQKNKQLLFTIGMPKKQIKKLKNDTKTVNKIVKTKTRNNEANRRSNIIRHELGYGKLGEHAPKRYWSNDKWETWYKSEQKKHLAKQRRAERKLKDDDDLYLLMFWRDKTAEGYADADLIKRYLHEYNYVDDEQLIDNTLYYMTTDKMGAELGTTLSVVIRGKERKQYIDLYTNISSFSGYAADSNDWVLVYEGKAKRLHPLLLAIHTIIRLLYDTSEKADFISTLIMRNLPMINKKMAEKLAKLLKWGGRISDDDD